MLKIGLLKPTRIVDDDIAASRLMQLLQVFATNDIVCAASGLDRLQEFFPVGHLGSQSESDVNAEELPSRTRSRSSVDCLPEVAVANSPIRRNRSRSAWVLKLRAAKKSSISFCWSGPS